MNREGRIENPIEDCLRKKSDTFYATAMYVQVQEQLYRNGKWQATPASLPLQDAKFRGDGLQKVLLSEGC